MTVSDAFKAAVAARSTSEVWIALVTITNDALSEPIYATDQSYQLLPTAQVRGVVSRGIEFIYMPFQLQLSAQNETGIVRARLAIDNIDRRMVLAVQQATGDVNVTIEIVLASDVNAVEMSEQYFILENVTFDANTVEGDLIVRGYDKEAFPCKRISPSGFAGLY